MITSGDVSSLAGKTGFRSDVVEKVLRLLDHGEIDAESLHPESKVQELVRKQPMLRWKAQNVREHRRKT